MEEIRVDLLPETVPLATLAVLAVAGALLWLSLHLLFTRNRSASPGFLRWCLLAVMASAAVWCGLQFAARFITLGANWTLWTAALTAGFSMEGVLALYRKERCIVSNGLGFALAALRVAAIGALLFILLQPAVTLTQKRTVSRRVALLFDRSASMLRQDRLWKEEEKADLALAWRRILPSENADALFQLPRAEIGRRLFSAGASSLLDAIESKYDVSLYRFATELAPLSEADVRSNAVSDVASPLRQEQTNVVFLTSSTDFTHALERVMATVPSEELAGVLLVTDGIHTGREGVEAIARQFGQSRVPISTVLVGGTRAPLDASIAEIRAPQSVFLGDRARVTPLVRVTGGKGKKILLRFFIDGEEKDKQTLEVDAEDWSREIRFTDLPAVCGLRQYRVAIDPVEGEETEENNSWNQDVFVTDERTNVLLVDSRPRWEFRYLKNLFYARDKSVQLQYFLTHPDTVEGMPPSHFPPASASRAFGDAESGSWPANSDEWHKFDVIILGDLDEKALTGDVVENIRSCVEERGALLVVIAGPENMPCRIRNKSFQDLLPVLYQESDADQTLPPEPAYRFQLTAAGRSHPVLQQSESVAENERIWSQMPELHWRRKMEGVKPGAEVLACAEPLETAGGQNTQRLVSEITKVPEKALQNFQNVRKEQAKNSLIVSERFGRGKVFFLTFDRTWRLRYRIGDTLHHRFWGQVVRWGTEEKLRAGNEWVRLGTDKLCYSETEPVHIRARFSDVSFLPVTNLAAEAVVSRGSNEIMRIRLGDLPGRRGMYEGILPPLSTKSAYSVALSCPAAQEALGTNFPAKVATQFSVVDASSPEESSRLAADGKVPQILAELSGGRVVAPSQAAMLADAFGEGRQTVTERKEWALWDSWAIFLFVTLCLTVEWLLRKKGGLA